MRRGHNTAAFKTGVWVVGQGAELKLPTTNEINLTFSPSFQGAAGAPTDGHSLGYLGEDLHLQHYELMSIRRKITHW